LASFGLPPATVKGKLADKLPKARDFSGQTTVRVNLQASILQLTMAAVFVLILCCIGVGNMGAMGVMGVMALKLFSPWGLAPMPINHGIFCNSRVIIST